MFKANKKIIFSIFNTIGSQIFYDKKTRASNIIQFNMYGKPAGIYFFRLQYNYQNYIRTFLYNN